MNMLEDAKRAIEASSKESSIYVGCDSIRYKQNGAWWASYCVVIIIHKDSKHGCNIFHKTEKHRDYGNLKQRLLTEVQLAVDTVIEIIDCVGDRHIEIHMDINPDVKHKSSVAVKESLSWARGLGVETKIKPDAFAATHAADHLVRR